MLYLCLLKALQNWGDNLFSCWEKSFLSSAQARWIFKGAQTTAEETIYCCEAMDQQFWGNKRRWSLIAVSSFPLTSLPKFAKNILQNSSWQVCLVKLRHTLSTYPKKTKCISCVTATFSLEIKMSCWSLTVPDITMIFFFSILSLVSKPYSGQVIPVFYLLILLVILKLDWIFSLISHSKVTNIFKQFSISLSLTN